MPVRRVKGAAMTAHNHESMKTLISGLSITRYQGLLKTELMKPSARRSKRCSPRGRTLAEATYAEDELTIAAAAREAIPPERQFSKAAGQRRLADLEQ